MSHRHFGITPLGGGERERKFTVRPPSKSLRSGSSIAAHAPFFRGSMVEGDASQCSELLAFTPAPMQQSYQSVLSAERGGSTINSKASASDTFGTTATETLRCETRTPLHEAVSSGQLELIPLVLQSGGGIDAVDCEGETAVHLCCTQKKWVHLNTLLHYGANPNLKDRLGRTPLHIACEVNAVQCCQCLLASGAEWDVSDVYGNHPIQRAIEKGNIGCMMEVLRGKPGSMPLVSRSGWNLLHEATSRNRHVMLRHIAESTSSAPPGEVGPGSVTCLHLAAYVGAMQCAKYLLSRGTSSSPEDVWGKAPLHWACSRGHNVLASLLIKNGAKLNGADHQGLAPVHIAAIAGQRECLVLLLQRGVSPSHPAKNSQRTPLHYLGVYAQLECMEMMLKGPWKCKVNTRDRFGLTPLHLAAFNGSTTCCAVLIKHGASLSLQCKKGFSPLTFACTTGSIGVATMLIGAMGMTEERMSRSFHVAAMYSSVDVVRILLNAGCNPHHRDTNGHTAVMSAAKGGNTAMCELLLSLGVNHTDIRKDTGESAAHFAAQNGHTEILKVLSRDVAGRDMLFTWTDHAGFTPLHYACMMGHSDAVRFLVRSAMYATKGITPSHCAARFGRKAVLEILSGEDDAEALKDANEAGPLHYAAYYGHTASVKYLCKACDTDWQDIRGDTALHKACFQGHVSVCTALLAAGSTINTPNRLQWLPLHVAAVASSACLTELLQAHTTPVAMQKLTPSGGTILHLAAKASNIETLQNICGVLDKLDSAFSKIDDSGMSIRCILWRTASVFAF